MDFEIAETSESNNVATLALNVLPRSDPAVTAISVSPNQPQSSAPVTIDGTITNRGYNAAGLFTWSLSVGALPPITGQAESLGAQSSLPVHWSGSLPAGNTNATLSLIPSSGTVDSFAENNSRSINFSVAASTTCVPARVTSAPVDLQVQIGQSPSFHANVDGTAPISVVWFRGSLGDASTQVSNGGPDFTDGPIYRAATYWVRATNACGSADSRVVTVSLAPPALVSAAVLNAASNAVGLVPGSLATIYGTGFTAQRGIQVPTSSAIPLSLGETTVEINGIAAPLLMVADVASGTQQINLQVPWEISPGVDVPIVISRAGSRSVPVGVAGLESQPGIFVVSTGTGAIVHTNYQLVTALNPAKADEILVLFATGLGPVLSPQATGSVATEATSTLRIPRVVLGAQDAAILYTGSAPGFAGLYQINFRVPPTLGPGDWPLKIVANVSSNEVTLPVR